MRLCKKITALILLSALLLPLSVFKESGRVSAANSLGENIPTIFLNDEAWYKHQLLPLIMRGDEPFVPISVFSGFEELSIQNDKLSGCILITGKDGSYFSVNTENGRYLTHTGERGSISLFTESREIYISAEKTAEVLGIGLQKAFYYDKNLIRLSSKDDLQSLDIIVDYYVTAPDNLSGSSSSPGGVVSRHETVAVLADLTEISKAVLGDMLYLTESINVTMTFAADLKFLQSTGNLSNIIKIAADGHSFAIKTAESSSADAIKEIEEANRLLTNITKQKTFLVHTTEENRDISLKGYTVLSGFKNISEIDEIGKLNFDKTDKIFFDKTDILNLSKFVAITEAAEKNGKIISAMNPLIGKK